MRYNLKQVEDRKKLKNRAERKTALARNLQVARKAIGITQQDLLEIGGYTRATISKIESGGGDPRISTIVDLATALGISPLLLLITKDELLAVADACKNLEDDIETIPEEVAVAFEFVNTATKKGLADAIQLAVENLKPEGKAENIGTAVGTVHQPGRGSQIGKALGKALGLE